jgi:hypothetical protein
MKIQMPIMSRLLVASAVATTLAFTATTSFGLIASDNSGNYGGAFVGENEGTGFGTWTSAVSGFGGSYIGGTGLSASSFGIYAGGGAGNSMAVFRPFESEMAIGDIFTIQLGYTGVDNAGEIGINLFSDSSHRLTLKFVGGNQFWKLNDGGADFDTNLEWAGGDPGATLNVQFTRGTGNAYSVVFTQGAVTYTGTDYVATSGVMAIDEVGLFSSAQGNSQNVGFNNLSVVPEPSTYALLGLGVVVLGGSILRRRKQA